MIKGIAAALACVGAVAASAGAQVTYSAVATTGTPVGNSGLTIVAPYRHTLAPITGAGKVGFVAEVAGNGVAPGTNALIFGDRGSLEVVAIDGQVLAGSPHDVQVLGLDSSQFAVGREGNLALYSGYGVWVGRPGDMDLVMRTDVPIAGRPAGTEFNYIERLSVNAHDQFALQVNFRENRIPFPPGPPRSGVITGSRQGVTLLAVGGDLAPGSGGRTFRDVGWPILNNAGHVAFVGYMEPGGGVDNGGIWVAKDGQIQPVAVTGQPAAGTPGTYTNISAPFNMSGSGVIGFRSWVDVPGGGARLFVSDDRGARLIGQNGQPAPGTPSTFDHFNWPDVNDRGQVAVLGHFAEESRDWGIWAGDVDDLRLVTRLGEDAPGTAYKFIELWNPAINNGGQTLFFASFGVDESQYVGRGLWATDTSGALHLIIASGQELTLDGVTRTVDEFWINLEDLDGMNDAGQIGFRVGFTDQSSAIVVATVPEPAANLGVAVLWLMCKGRRGRITVRR